MWVPIPSEIISIPLGNSCGRHDAPEQQKEKEILDDTVLCVTDDAAPL